MNTVVTSLHAQVINKVKAVFITGMVALLAAYSVPALALEFQCEVPGDTRYIRVDIPGEDYLCEVSVTYKESGVREVKWHASNDSLFCSARAYEMVEKYRNTWSYDCNSWPDRDGIDLLSPTQRGILDKRLQSLRAEGAEAATPFTVRAIKAAASTPLDKEPGKIALQFFTDNGDFTEIINDQSESWSVQSTIVDLASQVDGGIPPDYALVHAIDNNSTLEVHTQLTENNLSCYGSQLLSTVGSSGVTQARSPHVHICDTSISEGTAQ